MIALVVAIGLLLYGVLASTPGVKGASSVRLLFVVGLLGIAVVAVQRTGAASEDVAVAALVTYFALGGVGYAWERWQDGAAARIAKAKSAALAPQRMRKPLPPARPTNSPTSAPARSQTRGTP